MASTVYAKKISDLTKRIDDTFDAEPCTVS